MLDPSVYPLKEWYIATQNIKGLVNITKQVLLFNLMKQENIDIMILTETNSSKDKLKHMNKLQTKYKIFETPTPTANKGLGYGVAIILSKQIETHVYQHNSYKSYDSSLKLSFKGKNFVNIIGIYNPQRINKTEKTERIFKNG